MFTRSILALAMTLVFPLLLLADEPVSGEQLPKELIGTWKMVAGKYGGREADLPKRLQVLKHITPTHMTWMRAEPESGEVVAMACGRWKLDGDQYSETPEFGMGREFEAVKDATHRFTCKVVGDQWYHTGKLANGLTIEERWERQQVQGEVSSEESRKPTP